MNCMNPPIINDCFAIELIPPPVVIEEIKIKNEDIKKIICFIPPKSEQQKIVSILSNVDETLEKTNQLIKKIEQLDSCRFVGWVDEKQKKE